MTSGPDPSPARHSERAEYRERGFIVLRQVLPTEMLSELRCRFDRLGASARSTQVLYTHREPPPGRRPMASLMDQWFGRLQADPTPLLSTVGHSASVVAGAPMLPFQDVALRKAPHHRAFPWHQDQPFWPIQLLAGAVTWIPLCPVNAGNGGV